MSKSDPRNAWSGFAVHGLHLAGPPDPNCCTSTSALCPKCARKALGMTTDNAGDEDDEDFQDGFEEGYAEGNKTVDAMLADLGFNELENDDEDLDEEDFEDEDSEKEEENNVVPSWVANRKYRNKPLQEGPIIPTWNFQDPQVEAARHGRYQPVANYYGTSAPPADNHFGHEDDHEHLIIPQCTFHDEIIENAQRR